MYRRALLTVLSTENARAKIGSGCVLLRPASSIHFAEPQSDCWRSPVSKVAGALQAETSPAASHTLHLPGGRLPRRERLSIEHDVRLLGRLDLPGLPQVRPGRELGLRGGDADLVGRLLGRPAGAGELPAEVGCAVADPERLRQAVRLQPADGERRARRRRGGPEDGRRHDDDAPSPTADSPKGHVLSSWPASIRDGHSVASGRWPSRRGKSLVGVTYWAFVRADSVLLCVDRCAQTRRTSMPARTSGLSDDSSTSAARIMPISSTWAICVRAGRSNLEPSTSTTA